MRIILVIMALLVSLGVHAAWYVSPGGGTLTYSPKDATLPTVVPDGDACLGSMIQEFAGGPPYTAQVYYYTADAKELAVLCTWVNDQPPPPPPVIPQSTAAVTYPALQPQYDSNGVLIPVTSLASYTQYYDGIGWTPWVRRSHDLSGCFSFPIATASNYQMYVTAVNSFGESPQKNIIAFVSTPGITLPC